MAHDADPKGPITKCPECTNDVQGIGDIDDLFCPECGSFLDNPPASRSRSRKDE